MKHLFKHTLSFAILMALLLLTSCGTRKVTGSLTGPHPEKARFESVVNQAYKFEAMQSKVKLTMGKSGLNGKLSLEPGQRFALSVNAPLLGFEIGRVEATPDSVFIVDKYDKLYTVISLADVTQIEALAGHELEALECLMLGRIFIPGVGTASSRDFSRLAWSTPTLPDGTQGQSLGTFDGGNYRLVYSLDANGRLASTTLLMPDGKSATWSYEGYRELDKQKSLPQAEAICATNASGKSISAGLSLTNPSLGSSTWRPFSPSSAFRRVTLQELGEVLKKLAN